MYSIFRKKHSLSSVIPKQTKHLILSRGRNKEASRFSHYHLYNFRITELLYNESGSFPSPVLINSKCILFYRVFPLVWSQKRTFIERKNHRNHYRSDFISVPRQKIVSSVIWICIAQNHRVQFWFSTSFRGIQSYQGKKKAGLCISLRANDGEQHCQGRKCLVNQSFD